MEDYGGTPPLVCILPLFLKRKMFLPLLFVGKEDVHCTLYTKLVSPFPSSVFRLDTPCGKGGGPEDSTTSYHIC